MSSPSVLVVEDEPELLELLGQLFTQEGYRVLLAPDGEQAIQLALAGRPDLIVLDLMLPRKSGREVLSDLGADPTTSGIPVVVVSAYARSLVRPPQVKAVLDKPFDVWQLLGLTRRLLDGD